MCPICAINPSQSYPSRLVSLADHLAREHETSEAIQSTSTSEQRPLDNKRVRTPCRDDVLIDARLVSLRRNSSITTMMMTRACPCTPWPKDFSSARRDAAKRWHRIRDSHKAAFGMITRRLSAGKERLNDDPSRGKQLFEALAEPCEV